MKILIAGPYNSGGSRILECIRIVCKICNIPVKYGSYITFNSKIANEFEGVYIIKCNEFHEMYFNVLFFDYIFVPVRDIRYICRTELEAIKNVGLFRCWKSQATKILKYEDFNTNQVVSLFNIMNIKLEIEVIQYLEEFINLNYQNKNTELLLQNSLIQKNSTLQYFLKENQYV
jgi:hypothetical protein